MFDGRGTCSADPVKKTNITFCLFFFLTVQQITSKSQWLITATIDFLIALRGLRFVDPSKGVETAANGYRSRNLLGDLSQVFGPGQASVRPDAVASVGLRAEQRYLRVHVAQKYWISSRTRVERP